MNENVFGCLVEVDDHTEEYLRQVDAHNKAFFDRLGRQGRDMARGLVRVNTGETRDAIIYEASSSSVMIGIRGAAGKTKEILPVQKGIWQELGTLFIPAKPFLTPAAEYIGRQYCIETGSAGTVLPVKKISSWSQLVRRYKARRKPAQKKGPTVKSQLKRWLSGKKLK